MQKRTVYLFFSEANAIEAQEVEQNLKKANLSCISNLPTAEKVQQIAQNKDAIALMLVSDNYLKSIVETNNLEELLDEKHDAQLIPILTHGRRPKEGNPEQMEVYPTKIQTLNNVMYYRDFWYEEWISLRKQCKNSDSAEYDEVNVQKEIAKKMSVGSISTYIRRINALAPVDWEVFCSNSYQVLFDRIGMGGTAVEDRFNQVVESNSNHQEEVVVETPVVQNVHTANNNGNGTEEVLVETLTMDNPVEEKIVEEKIAVIENPIEELAIKTVTNGVEEVKEEVLVEEEKEIPVVVEEEKVEKIAIPMMEEKTITVEKTTETPTEKTFQPEVKEFVMQDLSNLNHVDSDSIYDQFKIEEVSNIDILFHIAEDRTEDALYDEARQAYERILKIDPYNGRAFIWLARLLAKHFENEALEAANTYRKAIMVNDENASLYYEYAMLQKDKFQSYNKARDAFREALDIDPLYEDAYYGLAFCQKEMGMPDHAKANYLQACVLDAARFETKSNDSYFGVIRRTAEAVPEIVVVHEKIKNPNADTIVMVTGATSGIGKAVAELFIMQGYKVIVTGRRAERLDSLKYDMEAQAEEAQVYCLPFDVCDLESVQKAIKSLPSEWANVDILINNAGLAKGFESVHEGNIAHWEAMINTNIKGLLYMTRMITPGMVERKKGHIINLSSAAGTQAYAGGGVYCATKAAVDSLTRTMRLDLYKHNIKVSSISPGHVDATEFATVRFDGSDKAKMYDDFKPLSAQDVADAVFYTVTRPKHVNIQDILMFGTQQASVNDVNRSGREN